MSVQLSIVASISTCKDSFHTLNDIVLNSIYPLPDPSSLETFIWLFESLIFPSDVTTPEPTHKSPSKTPISSPSSKVTPSHKKLSTVMVIGLDGFPSQTGLKWPVLYILPLCSSANKTSPIGSIIFKLTSSSTLI